MEPRWVKLTKTQKSNLEQQIFKLVQKRMSTHDQVAAALHIPVGLASSAMLSMTRRGILE